MKVKLSLLVTAVAILRTIDFTKMKLSTAYKVRQVLAKSQDAISDFENRRISLARELGELNEEKDRYIFTDKEKEEQSFRDQLQEWMDEDMDIDITPIPVDLLDDYITLEPTNIPFVEWFITGLK
jgi:hypothetical protein